MSLLTRLEQDFESLKVKLAGASARVEGYVATGIKLGNELEGFVNSGTGRLVIPEVLTRIGITDPAMQEDIINAIPKALSYATQAQGVLTAGTPEDQLNAFLEILKNDAPGTQVAKIDQVIANVIGSLDNNSLLPKIYGWLLGHTKTAISILPPVAPSSEPAPVVEVPAEVSPESANV